MSRQDANARFALTSFLYGGNSTYIDDLYARYEIDPNSVDAEWQAFFAGMKDSANGQQNAQFGRAEAPEGKAELAQSVSSQVGLNREHEERNQQAYGNPGMHMAGQCQAWHQGKGTEAVHHVVDIEPVARSQTLAGAGESAIERVAQPVESKADDHAEERPAIVSR